MQYLFQSAQVVDGQCLKGAAQWGRNVRLTGATLSVTPGSAGAHLELEVGGVPTGDAFAIPGGGVVTLSLALDVLVPAGVPVQWRAAAGSSEAAPSAASLTLRADVT